MQYVAQIENRLVGLPARNPERPLGPVSEPQPQNPTTTKSTDQVELSTSAAQTSGEDTELATRVARIRAAIQAGEYLTDDKIDVVVDRLHTEIFGK